jgi:hypothetical protein
MVISLSRCMMSNWDLLGIAIIVLLVMWRADVRKPRPPRPR